MRLFLDTSVLLAVAGSANGASRAIFTEATDRGWWLLCSPYALREVTQNLPKLPIEATTAWGQLQPKMTLVADVVSLDRPVVFPASKDRPILFTALAWADVLLTLDQADFADVLGRSFYGLRVMRPYEYLLEERLAGRL